jgi:hypothetical protein
MTIPPAEARRVIHRPEPGETSGPFVSGPLAPEVLAAIGPRLTVTALLYATCGLLIHFIYMSLPSMADQAALAPWWLINAVNAGVSLGVALLARSNRVRPAVLLDVALFYWIVGAIGIDIGHIFVPLERHDMMGLSWTAVWIIIFPALVPVTPGKALLSALACASALPFMLLLRRAMGDEVAMPGPAVATVIGSYICAGLAFIVARIVHGLSRDVSRARRMGSYVLTEKLGSGGMGEVWRAEHRLLARPAAVKLVRLDNGSSSDHHDSLRRFEREARATAALTSPHAVALYDYGVSGDGSFFYVMELLHGLDFHDLVDRHGPQSPARVISLLSQACDALAEAHAAGLVHRDIKPANLFICRRGTIHDFVKVLDFGLVKTAGGDQTVITQQGVAAGTPAYMAPEIALGESAVDGRADIYALGCVGYFLLTGEPVFARDNPMQAALAHVQAPVVPPSRRSETAIPIGLEAIIMACLEKDRDGRPRDAQALRDLLAAVPIEPWGQPAAARWWRSHLPSLAG